MSFEVYAQSIGTPCAASMANRNAFTVGDIFVNSESGMVGSVFTIAGQAVSLESLHKDDILIYPNPAQSEFVIQLKSSQTTESIYLIDQLGRKIKSLSALEKNEISSLQSGIYFIIINNVKSAKLIKQ